MKGKRKGVSAGDQDTKASKAKKKKGPLNSDEEIAELDSDKLEASKIGKAKSELVLTKRWTEEEVKALVAYVVDLKIWPTFKLKAGKVHFPKVRLAIKKEVAIANWSLSQVARQRRHQDQDCQLYPGQVGHDLGAVQGLSYSTASHWRRRRQRRSGQT